MDWLTILLLGLLVFCLSYWVVREMGYASVTRRLREEIRFLEAEIERERVSCEDVEPTFSAEQRGTDLRDCERKATARNEMHGEGSDIEDALSR